MTSANAMPNETLDVALETHATEFARLDEAIMLDAVGVAQAATDLRVALDAFDDLLDERRLEKAAALGYRDIASAFVFLQRTLGALQGTDHDLSAVVSEVAAATGRSYEDVEPAVLTRIGAMRPRPEADASKAVMGAKGRLALPDPVQAHLGVETGATLSFEPLPGGRVVMEVADPGPLADILAEMRVRMGRTASPEDDGMS